MGFIRMVVFGFLAMTVVFVSVSLYSRSVRKERLENEFDANPPEGADAATRDAYIDKGMAEYHSSIRPKLIGLVYVIPIFAVSIIVYVVNTN